MVMVKYCAPGNEYTYTAVLYMQSRITHIQKGEEKERFSFEDTHTAYNVIFRDGILVHNGYGQILCTVQHIPGEVFVPDRVTAFWNDA
jgi:hypothetical protein